MSHSIANKFIIPLICNIVNNYSDVPFTVSPSAAVPITDPPTILPVESIIIAYPFSPPDPGPTTFLLSLALPPLLAAPPPTPLTASRAPEHEVDLGAVPAVPPCPS